jgi:DNA-binding transcriptional MerR regulator
MPEGAALTIGEVINLLKDEFPDVSVSKVRFLEDQGLIHLARSRSGYRQFHEHDVKRLRFILREQRDHFLPLKVIKSKLTMWDRGEEPAELPSETAAVLSDDAWLTVPEGEYDQEELQRRAGLTPAHLGGLIEHGILPEEGPYHAADLAMASQAGRLLAYGLEPRHLRVVLTGAERAADLLNRLTEPQRRHRSPESRRRLHDVLTGGADALERLYHLLLTSELRRTLER